MTVDIAAIRKLAEAATQGVAVAGEMLCAPDDSHWDPLVRGWFKAGIVGAPMPQAIIDLGGETLRLAREEAVTTCLFSTEADAKAWAASRTLVPQLCDEVERLTAERDEARAAAEQMKIEVFEASEENFACAEIAVEYGCLVANAPHDAVRSLANKYEDAVHDRDAARADIERQTTALRTAERDTAERIAAWVRADEDLNRDDLADGIIEGAWRKGAE